MRTQPPDTEKDKAPRFAQPSSRFYLLIGIIVVLAFAGVASVVASDLTHKGGTTTLTVTPTATTRLVSGPSTSTQSAPALKPDAGKTTAPPKASYPADPVAPVPQPARPDPGSRFFTETGHLVSSDFLQYYNSVPGAADLFGLPLTEEFEQQLPGAGTFRVQYFERARMEYHPELPDGQHVQLGSLGVVVLGGRSFDRLPTLSNTSTRAYFLETGHTISNGFLKFWNANGGLSIFGYPLSEEMGEDGVTVQYFERARFEYRKDLEPTGYAVQVSPLGYQALKSYHYNIPMGTLVRFEPPHAAEGHSVVVEVAATAGMTVTGQYEGRPLLFALDASRGVAWAMLGTVPFEDTGKHPVSITMQNADGGRRTVTRTLDVVSYPFPSEDLQFDPETAKLLDPAITVPELQFLDTIFSKRTPEKYWGGYFRMPLDGNIRITSYFATRRCYACDPGTPPTTYHGGMDMAAAEGTPVHAPAAGRVVFADHLNVRGNVVIIDHGMGVYTLLAHNSKLLARVGQMVQPGDVVSLSGNTGLSIGPHVHWEVHVSGPDVEPLEWVNRLMP